MRIFVYALLALALACGSGRDAYEVEGTVKGVDLANIQVKISHEDIPGLMPAMTMNFDVVSPDLLEGLDPGMRVRFDLERDETSLLITAIEILSGPSGRSGVAAGPPVAELDDAPNIKLTDHRFKWSSMGGVFRR